MNKLVLATVLAATFGFSAVSQAAPTPAVAPTPVKGDFSSTFLEWSGFAKVIPGDDIVITGARSGAVEDGVLTVKGDGTFETKTPIVLESRLYWDQGSGSKTAGELFATNWTIDADGISASWGANSTAGMDIKMTDIASGTELTSKAGVSAVSTVTLSVNSVAPVTSATSLNLLEPLVVNANVLATVA
ncbi:hypothetical protein [Photobacterium iliopiscarium]|uniref:hypothetical protein n=1 Tax=Photobacterium iliopiscarium TaxID=56192 RepID=UPI0005D37AA3|nr:hypothetical protein [Photobacterium iliopiscarium]KJG13634.1 hypothetical protein UB38_08360 [Photobacterium iliopiscarium]PST99184.1 hypothetical protein C9I85_11580 [Photobacterium iliopiscarium]PSV85042.1 hypothetical protein C9J51_01830 [Photobacterium iliopiscarium]